MLKDSQTLKRVEEEDKNEPQNYAKYITLLLLIVLIIQLLFIVFKIN